MLVSEFPGTLGLREVPRNELPADVRAIVAGISEGISERMKADPIITDVFRIGNDGAFSANPSSKILSGHFPGMPLVPGVVAKRLLAVAASVDPYGPSSPSNEWKTEFPAAISGTTENVMVRQEESGCSLVSGDTVLVRMVRRSRTEDTGSEGRFDLRSHNLKDVLIDRIGSIPRDDADAYVFQEPPFRFVTTAGSVSDEDEGILGGYFDVPEDFPYLTADETVPAEIIEEAVAQIASFAYAKTRNFPAVREDGGVNPKAKILTFKSSVSEAGENQLRSRDHLSVAINLISENGREVVFAYEAWNATHCPVLRGVIEGTVVPFRLLKKIAG